MSRELRLLRPIMAIPAFLQITQNRTTFDLKTSDTPKRKKKIPSHLYSTVTECKVPSLPPDLRLLFMISGLLPLLALLLLGLCWLPYLFLAT